MNFFCLLFFYIFNCTYAKTKPNTSAKSKCRKKHNDLSPFSFEKTIANPDAWPKQHLWQQLLSVSIADTNLLLTGVIIHTKCINVALCVCVYI